MESKRYSKILDEMRENSISSQKRGIHFIIASILIWTIILIIQQLNLTIKQQNLFSFCCFALLLPIAFVISKWLKIDFQSKENPLTILGILFTVNQILYLLIAMWAFSAVPEKMLMIIAIIFGGHLLPFSWLYKSKVYLICLLYTSRSFRICFLTQFPIQSPEAGFPLFLMQIGF